ncbi:hypothetical protein LROSL1_1423 [Furfurilactobacillus rossiae]|uniref:hypothetical protein n=1 Tax=Furfurilactobacillus rossiae TaxID=231049 RepID=UPI0015BFEA63|nr:hypothetical protein [Furfurilactobacillus rossiae]MCF6165470.1 hypothetical protein [Furfurilactobacillus rossiae]QLE64240.1 hypothetical protein LROSL1_1423 [Furfurilactobacillus rossiae]
MRLVDFKFSTADYDMQRPLFVAVDGNPQPVVSLTKSPTDHRLILDLDLTHAGRPLTLDAFVTRTQKLPGSWRIAAQAAIASPTTRELFGYRLIDEKIMFM